MMKGLLAAAAGVAMMTTGTVAAAQSAPAANPAVSGSAAPRAGSAGAHRSHIGASVPVTTLISIAILGALTAIVLVATHNDQPRSP